ncbi:hypothetical protein HK105_208367 [Polyrhizophydium stewartii]|uniref:Glutamate/phenylalanine/leucine/valine/L-tryptophan dehydrogenase C-terminal domain-containing protein n=1 Tax=Polyrhizophydium stewartii TaxID=2732419 RepID=A0ABR4MY12_9FUNG
MSKPAILDLTPAQFVDRLRQEGATTLHFALVDGRLVASHAFLQPIADFFAAEADDFDSHEGFFVQVGPESGGAFVHRTCRGPGAGGVRNWLYDSTEQFFRDGLRLSKGMTHKNALAGIWWGGGKGVMARNTGTGLQPGDAGAARRKVYEEYGSFMSALHGCYVTAEDVGTDVNDMAAIFSRTRHTTCIPAALGGSGNPSVPTARGVLRGLEAAFAFHGKDIVGSTVAVQGAGHVGMPLIQFLFERGVAKVIASDVDAHRADDIRAAFAGRNFELRIVDKADSSILFLDVDAVAPCATGGILNAATIPLIRTKIVCGAANNQLRDIKTDDKLLQKHGITYLPDFLVNRMGIVNCCDEHMGIIDDDPRLEEHLGTTWDNAIFNLSTAVLQQAASTGKTTQEIAIELAEKRSLEHNPIYGHRGAKVIKWLINSAEWKQKL